MTTTPPEQPSEPRQRTLEDVAREYPGSIVFTQASGEALLRARIAGVRALIRMTEKELSELPPRRRVPERTDVLAKHRVYLEGLIDAATMLGVEVPDDVTDGAAGR